MTYALAVVLMCCGEIKPEIYSSLDMCRDALLQYQITYQEHFWTGLCVDDYGEAADDVGSRRSKSWKGLPNARSH